MHMGPGSTLHLPIPSSGSYGYELGTASLCSDLLEEVSKIKTGEKRKQTEELFLLR